MTQLAQHPSYLQIEDRLDVVGQKYRVQRMRGTMRGCSANASLPARITSF